MTSFLKNPLAGKKEGEEEEEGSAEGEEAKGGAAGGADDKEAG
jgi:hypothetical protein